MRARRNGAEAGFDAPLRRWFQTLLVGLAVAGAPMSAHGQVPGVRELAQSMRFPPLRFHPPEPTLHHVHGVPVLYLQDAAVPLTTVLARFEGGFAHFPRDLYAAGTALPALLRYGGTEALPPDSVDERLEYYALQTTFGGGGESVFASMNTLTEHLEATLPLWASMLRNPRFDTAQLEIWRGREFDAVRRFPDDPQRLAFSEFNHLMYGDHSVGWELGEDDLQPAALSVATLRFLQERIVCRENMLLGVTGDVPWTRLQPLLSDLLEGWPGCVEPLPELPSPSIRDQGGVFLISRPLEQSVLVMAHPTDVRLGDGDYFAAQIGNTILGAGGFSSRLLNRVRTQEGYAYSASSLWTSPRRYKGLVGAVTRTRPENAPRALRLILDILDEMKAAPPEGWELTTAVEQIANGFVFNFETAAQIVSRRMSFLAQDLPEDWLDRYLEGVQGVTPTAVQDVFRKHVRPRDMTILVVGDPDRMGWEALAALGPVTVLEPRSGEAR